MSFTGTVKTHDEEIRFKIMISILVMMGSVVVMATLNANGYMEVNYAFTVIGALLIVGKATSLAAIGIAFAIGLGIGTTKGEPLKGASEGVVWWFTKGIPSLILVWWATSAFLASTSFEREPFAIVPVLVFGGAILWACLAYGVLGGKTMFWIIVIYSVVAITLALAKTNPTVAKLTGQSPPAYTATGTNYLINPVTGKRFEFEPQVGCRDRRDCFDPDHGSASGGTRLVPFNALLEQSLTSKGSQTPVSSRPQPNVVQPPAVEECTARRPCEVVIPRCGGEQDWVVVTIPAGWGMTPQYQQAIAERQFLVGSRWLSSLAGVNGNVVAVRYCTNEILYVNDTMSLTWEP